MYTCTHGHYYKTSISFLFYYISTREMCFSVSPVETQDFCQSKHKKTERKTRKYKLLMSFYYSERAKICSVLYRLWAFHGTAASCGYACHYYIKLTTKGSQEPVDPGPECRKCYFANQGNAFRVWFQSNTMWESQELEIIPKSREIEVLNFIHIHEKSWKGSARKNQWNTINQRNGKRR